VGSYSTYFTELRNAYRDLVLNGTKRGASVSDKIESRSMVSLDALSVDTSSGRNNRLDSEKKKVENPPVKVSNDILRKYIGMYINNREDGVSAFYKITESYSGDIEVTYQDNEAGDVRAFSYTVVDFSAKAGKVILREFRSGKQKELHFRNSKSSSGLFDLLDGSVVFENAK
jgi:hypothetical protein